jgi:hypothetical protein
MRFVGASCRSAARTSWARIALYRRLLRRHSPTEKHVGSFLLSTAARDPSLIASLAKARSRGSRFIAAYFVVTRRRKSMSAPFSSARRRAIQIPPAFHRHCGVRIALARRDSIHPWSG